MHTYPSRITTNQQTQEQSNYLQPYTKLWNAVEMKRHPSLPSSHLAPLKLGDRRTETATHPITDTGWDL